MNMHYTPQDRQEIENAVLFMTDQFLKFNSSGKPIILHSIMVGTKAMELNLSKEAVIAGFLHDVVEDSKCSVNDIANKFDKNVTRLVSALTFDENISDYKKRYRISLKKIIQAGRETMLLKIIDSFDNFPFVIFISSRNKFIEIMWKYQFVMDSLEKYLKNEKIFQKYKNTFLAVKTNFRRS